MLCRSVPVPVPVGGGADTGRGPVRDRYRTGTGSRDHRRGISFQLSPVGRRPILR